MCICAHDYIYAAEFALPKAYNDASPLGNVGL